MPGDEHAVLGVLDEFARVGCVHVAGVAVRDDQVPVLRQDQADRGVQVGRVGDEEFASPLVARCMPGVVDGVDRVARICEATYSVPVLVL